MANYDWNEVGAKPETTTWSGEQVGDSIYGVVSDFKEVTRKDGTKGNVLSLTNPDTGESYNVWAKSQLLRLLLDAGIDTGKMIKIEYLGKQPLKTDRTKSFRSYKLFVAGKV